MYSAGRLRFRSPQWAKRWNNGHVICDQRCDFHRECSVGFTLEEGANRLLFKMGGIYYESKSASLAHGAGLVTGLKPCKTGGSA